MEVGVGAEMLLSLALFRSFVPVFVSTWRVARKRMSGSDGEGG